MGPTDGRIFGIRGEKVAHLFIDIQSAYGIEGLTFHDTRHEAITRLSKKLSALELAAAVGHKNVNQLLTYYNESATDIAKKLD